MLLTIYVNLCGLFCADVPLRNYSLTHSLLLFLTSSEYVEAAYESNSDGAADDDM